jgi:serine/threonine protein kinase
MIEQGQRLGKYEILGEIGRGGFAVVYRARDPTLDRVIALKVLAPHLTWDRTFAERFRLEAQSTARLRHPHIVKIHEVGQDDERPYIAMEYLTGRTLTKLLETEGAMSPERALPFLEQIADALDHAHSEGVIHRDVKPRNVMMEETRQGVRVTLMDFGLMKAMESSESLTSAGTILGSPEYMAPEQADPNRRDEIGSATDLYALGVVAYHMLTGRVPFPGNTPATLNAHLNLAPPDPKSICKDLPASVARVLLKALSKSPDERYPTAMAMVQALHQSQVPEKERRRIGATAPSHTRVGQRIVAIVSLAVAIGIGIWGWPYVRKIFVPSPTVVVLVTPSSTSLTPIPTPNARATVLSLLETEKEAVLTENMNLIQAIFDPDATKTDAATSQSWNAIQRYAETFTTEDHLEITHTNIAITITGDKATVTNDSCGSLVLKATGQKIDYNCPQCDRWTFRRDANGRWWITSMTYSLLSTASSHQYTFEDGTNGCWDVRYDSNEPQGQRPTLTTEFAYQGHGSLRFTLDLAQVSTHRGQTIRYNMPFAGYASAYVYVPPDAPADLEAGFFAMELDHDPWNYHEASQMSRLIPGQWTEIRWNVGTAGWAQPLHLLGIEVRQAGQGTYKGYVLIDDVFIQSQ